jgi:translation initiation factor IF-3
MNDRIRVREVRLIDAEGRQVGIVPTDEARRLAIEAGKDLVEVAPDGRPPVCKIMDYGKYKYEQKKKQHGGKKVHHARLKEIRLRPKTEDHDYDVKLRHAKEFLAKGDKVQICLMFRGRELVHKARGEEVLQRFIADLQDLAKVERSGPYEGKRMTVLLARK